MYKVFRSSILNPQNCIASIATTVWNNVCLHAFTIYIYCCGKKARSEITTRLDAAHWIRCSRTALTPMHRLTDFTGRTAAFEADQTHKVAETTGNQTEMEGNRRVSMHAMDLNGFLYTSYLVT